MKSPHWPCTRCVPVFGLATAVFGQEGVIWEVERPLRASDAPLVQSSD